MERRMEHRSEKFIRFWATNILFFLIPSKLITRLSDYYRQRLLSDHLTGKNVQFKKCEKKSYNYLGFPRINPSVLILKVNFRCICSWFSPTIFFSDRYNQIFSTSKNWGRFQVLYSSYLEKKPFFQFRHFCQTDKYIVEYLRKRLLFA